LPANLQAAFQPIQTNIAGTVHDLSEVLKSDAPLNDKVHRVSATVRERVTPILDVAADAIRTVVQRAETASNQNTTNGTANGQANGSAH
jgi:uncharacterized protein YoxC